MECPKCGNEFEEEWEHSQADYADEFEVTCEACEAEFLVEAHVSYTYRIMGESEVSDGTV